MNKNNNGTDPSGQTRIFSAQNARPNEAPVRREAAQQDAVKRRPAADSNDAETRQFDAIRDSGLQRDARQGGSHAQQPVQRGQASGAAKQPVVKQPRPAQPQDAQQQFARQQAAQQQPPRSQATRSQTSQSQTVRSQATQSQPPQLQPRSQTAQSQPRSQTAQSQPRSQTAQSQAAQQHMQPQNTQPRHARATIRAFPNANDQTRQFDAVGDRLNTQDQIRRPTSEVSRGAAVSQNPPERTRVNGNAGMGQPNGIRETRTGGTPNGARVNQVSGTHSNPANGTHTNPANGTHANPANGTRPDDTRLMPAVRNGSAPTRRPSDHPRQSGSALTPAGRLTPQSGRTPAARSPQKNPAARGRSGIVNGKKPLKRPSGLDDYEYQDHGSGSEIVGGTLSSVFKAIIYIVAVLVVSAFLSVFGISVCNDVFAFVKDTAEVEINVPEYASISEVAKILKEAGVVDFPQIFTLYAEKRNEKGISFVSGSHTVSASMNYDLLLSELTESTPERTTVSVTIPEGYTIDDIINLFVNELGMGTEEGFRKALEEYEWDYWFVQELKDNGVSEERKYLLEGYLFPDTYYYYSDANETTIVWKMLENFNDKFDESMKTRCGELGYTVDEIVTMASMIQMEAKYPSEYPDISSVFHNRLNNTSYETQGKLESDPTIMYMLEGHQTNLTQEEKQLDTHYNTYLYKGLPPSAISNPSLYAINCALYPNTTNYYYFYAISSGYHIFAETYAQHIQNIIDATKQ